MNQVLSAADAGRSVEPRRRTVAVDAVIVLSAAAGFAHLVAAPSHYTWWPAAGVFFVALGVTQLGFAALMVRGAVHRTVVLVGLWATVGVILLYVASRTVGIPAAPPVPAHGGRWVIGRSIIPDGAKHVGPLDVFTLVCEVLLVVTLLGMLPSKIKARSVNGLLVIGLTLWGAGIVAFLR